MHIGVTGHRPDKLNKEWIPGPISMRLKKKFIQILSRNPDSIGIEGGALGVDTIFAEACIELGRRFIIAIPFEGQEKKWQPKDQERYNFIRNHRLARVEVIDEEFVPNLGFGPDFRIPALMQKRNKWVVDRCDGLVSAWDGSPGGTKNCVDYARSVHKPIIHLLPKQNPLVERAMTPELYNYLTQLRW